MPDSSKQEKDSYTGTRREVSIPDWYGSDRSEESRKPTKAEGKYIELKIRHNKTIVFFGIFTVLIFSLYFFIFENQNEGVWVISLSGIIISTLMYFFSRKYVFCSFEKNKDIRLISGRPIFTAGRLAFHSGFHLYARVDGIQFRVPLHWAFHLLGYNFGEQEVEVEIYETDSESYALSISNGLSIEKEAGNGLFDLLMDGRRLYVVLSALVIAGFATPILMDSGALMMIGLQEPAFHRLPDTWSELFFQTPSLIFGGLTVVLGPPALWFYAKHRKALRSIKEMYREEGVIE